MNQQISEAIAKAEAHTSGEIRVTLQKSLPWWQRRKSIFDLALREFHRLGMTKTRDRTGVLLFLLLNGREFQIIADEGIHTKVPQGTWDQIAAKMIPSFQEGRLAEGICAAVAQIGEVLARHFPQKANDPNELPNDVIHK